MLEEQTRDRPVGAALEILDFERLDAAWLACILCKQRLVIDCFILLFVACGRHFLALGKRVL